MLFRTPPLVRAGMIAGAFALGACAGGVMDDFDSAQTRIITPTEATSTCIGDISTPLCTVETFLACMRRLERSFCEQVGVFGFSLRKNPEPVRYRILSGRILRDQDIPDHLRHTFWMKAGYADITIIYLDWHTPDCFPEGCRADFSLKLTPSGWQVVSWAVQGYD